MLAAILICTSVNKRWLRAEALRDVRLSPARRIAAALAIGFCDGLFLVASMLAGAAAGARFAIKRGSAYVRPLFLGVTALLIGKQLWDLIVP